MIDPVSDNILEEAIDRIARTPDGSLLYLFLQRRLMSVDVPNVSGALRQDQGERRFAARLIDLMRKGILESGKRTGSDSDPTGLRSGEQPIVAPAREPGRVRGPRGAARRVTERTVVPGWNDERPG